MLHRSTVPVFDNVADMLAELGFLIFLTRSYSVWGVCSRVSGPFGPEKYEQVVSTCDRLLEFVFAPPFVVDPPEVTQPPLPPKRTMPDLDRRIPRLLTSSSMLHLSPCSSARTQVPKPCLGLRQ